MFFLHSGSRWMPNVLIRNETVLERITILEKNPADWVHECLCFEPSALIWTKGFRRLSVYCEEKKIWTIFFKFSQGMCSWMAFARNFFGFFFSYTFFRGFVRHINNREYVPFRSSNISCSMAGGLSFLDLWVTPMHTALVCLAVWNVIFSNCCRNEVFTEQPIWRSAHTVID